MTILTRQQVREVDRRAIEEYGMSGLVLMENAGRTTANLLFRLMSAEFFPATKQFQSGPVTIVCGKGNNGGDGFVIARHLDLFGLSVRVLLLCSPEELVGDAATNYSIARKGGISIDVFTAPLDIARFDAAIAGSAWLVDAILGTGASGEPRSPYAEAIDRMNASGLPILAVDLPSGLDCDSGAHRQSTPSEPPTPARLWPRSPVSQPKALSPMSGNCMSWTSARRDGCSKRSNDPWALVTGISLLAATLYRISGRPKR